jgi:hypothetical protein
MPNVRDARIKTNNNYCFGLGGAMPCKCACVTFVILLIIGQIACASVAIGETISNPVQVISPEKFESISGVDYQPDAPITTYQVNGERRWLVAMWNKAHGGIDHMESTGSVDRPFAKLVGVKPQNVLFQYDHNRFSGSFWIVNTYETDAGLLAFVHVENAEGSQKHTTRAAPSTGKSRIGLAWSSDGGKSFQFLGHILIPFGDPEPSNIQGLPYIIRGEYFYVYFHDTTGLTVARAPVSEVLEAAKNGEVSGWMKYNGPELGFSSLGLGGSSKRLGIDGISHSDAACSSYNDKCYLVLTRMNWKQQDTWIMLFETVDGVIWKFKHTIVREPASSVKGGYQYATITDESGSDNGVIGQRFFIYSLKDHQDSTRAAYRWKVDLGN